MGTGDDAFISNLILEAQADIDREVGYMFQQDGTSGTPATRIYSGKGKEELWIDDLISLYAGGGCSPTPCGAVFETVQNTYLSSSGIWIVGSTTTTDITADVVLK